MGYGPIRSLAGKTFKLEDSVNRRVLYIFLAITIFSLIFGVYLRLKGIGWGIIDLPWLQATYHFDEDKVINAIRNLSPFHWNVHDFRLGTFHFYLVAAALKIAEWTGYLSFYHQPSFDATKVFVVGRLVSVILGLLTIPLVYLVGNKAGGVGAGILSVLFFSILPLHVLDSHFIAPDVSMCFFVMLAFYITLFSFERGSKVIYSLQGLFFGLAVATKYSAVPIFVVIVLSHFLQKDISWERKAITYPFILLGFFIGEPYAFVCFSEFHEQLRGMRISHTSGEASLILSMFLNIWFYAKNIALYCMGIPTFVISLFGITLLIKRKSHASTAPQSPLSTPLLSPLAKGGREGMTPLYPPLAKGGIEEGLQGGDKGEVKLFNILIFTSIVVFFLFTILSRFQFIRFSLPLIIFLCVTCSIYLVGVKNLRLQLILIGLCVLFPLVLSIRNVNIMTGEHTAASVYNWVDENVEPGSSLLQEWREIPPIQPGKYIVYDYTLIDPEIGLKLKPDYIIRTDLTPIFYNKRLTEQLNSDYKLLATFKKTILSQKGKPHDLKYTHPEISIYGLSTTLASLTANKYTVKNNRIDFKDNSSIKYLRRGWTQTESYGTWAEGKESVMIVNFEETGSYLMRIKATPYTVPDKRQAVKVFVNDEFIGEHSFTKPFLQWETFEITIPAKYLKPGTTKIKFIYSYAISPKETKQGPGIRKLAVAFESIEFTKL
ncbi:MAG TPA: ArnT family glycosyltransferase [Candidatus Brocadiia bacterium]|nr:glycosyltransferase family 39 protein [Candidatus Brocadiales bacterium]